MVMPRQLHHEGFEGWGHTIAGFTTDYVLFVVSAACLGYLLVKTRRPYDALQKLFMVFLATQAVSFGCGGVSHHMLNIYASGDEVMGKEWSGSNSGWMYPWVVAVALSPISSGCLVASVLVLSKLPLWIARVSVVLGLLAAAYEIAVFIREDLDSSGVASALRAASASGVSLLVLVVGMLGRFVDLSKKASCWSSEARVGAVQVLAGIMLTCVAWGLVLGAPASCSKVGAARTDCPFPDEFNHNAIFHTLLIIAAPLLSWGIRLRTRVSSSSAATLEKDKPAAIIATADVDVEQGNNPSGAAEVQDNSDKAQPTLLGNVNEEPASPKSPKAMEAVKEPDVAPKAEEDFSASVGQAVEEQAEKEQTTTAASKQMTQEGQLEVNTYAADQADEAAPKTGCGMWCAA